MHYPEKKKFPLLALIVPRGYRRIRLLERFSNGLLPAPFPSHGNSGLAATIRNDATDSGITDKTDMFY